MTSPPPPPLTISTYFPCSAKHFAEGTPLRLRGDSSSTWVVKKLRNVGEPIDKMCEAWRLHAGSERIDAQAALRIWEQLPGKSSWAPINSLLINRGRASAKLLAPRASSSGCTGPQLAPPDGPCAPLLFVARAVSNVSLAATAEQQANRTLLLSRVSRDELYWRTRRERSRGRSACSDAVSLMPPRVYTAAGLRDVLASGLCSRACTATRMRRQRQQQQPRLDEPTPWLLESADNAPGSTVVLVISRWQQHLAHLQQQPFCYLVVEKAEGSYAKQQGVDYVVPNRANEASSYLHFIARHYDDALPDTMVFLQDERESKHSVDVISLLRHVRLDAAPYLPLNSVHLPFLHPQAYCHVRSCVEQSGLLRRLGAAFAPSHMMDLAYTCCAQFVVSATAVKAHPRALYEDLYRYALAGTDYGQRGDSFARGECLEVLWHHLFGGPKVAPPTPAELKCGRAAAASPQLAHNCSERSGLEAFVPANDSFWSWAAPVWRSFGSDRMRRDGFGGLFGAAVRSGELTLASDDSAEPLRRMESGGIRARVRRLGGAERVLSTNCTVLAQQDAATTGRRKFARTLRQCPEGIDAWMSRSARAKRRGRGRPLHQLALCTMFQASRERTSAFLKRLRSASV